MKKGFLVCVFAFFFMTYSTFADPIHNHIHNFEELKIAIQEGKRITILLDTANCGASECSSPRCFDRFFGIKGYFTPNSFMFIPEAEKFGPRIVTSHLHFTDHSCVPVYEFIKYTFFSDNFVEVHFTSYGARNFVKKGHTNKLHCVIGKGIEVIVE